MQAHMWMLVVSLGGLFNHALLGYLALYRPNLGQIYISSNVDELHHSAYVIFKSV